MGVRPNQHRAGVQSRALANSPPSCRAPPHARPSSYFTSGGVQSLLPVPSCRFGRRRSHRKPATTANRPTALRPPAASTSPSAAAVCAQRNIDRRRRPKGALRITISLLAPQPTQKSKACGLFLRSSVKRQTVHPFFVKARPTSEEEHVSHVLGRQITRGAHCGIFRRVKVENGRELKQPPKMFSDDVAVFAADRVRGWCQCE